MKIIIVISLIFLLSCSNSIDNEIESDEISDEKLTSNVGDTSDVRQWAERQIASEKVIEQKTSKTSVEKESSYDRSSNAQKTSDLLNQIALEKYPSAEQNARASWVNLKDTIINNCKNNQSSDVEADCECFYELISKNYTIDEYFEILDDEEKLNNLGMEITLNCIQYISWDNDDIKIILSDAIKVCSDEFSEFCSCSFNKIKDKYTFIEFLQGLTDNEEAFLAIFEQYSILYCGHLVPTPVPTPSPTPTPIITLDDIRKEMGENIFAASKKYEGEAVRIDFKIDRMRISTLVFLKNGSLYEGAAIIDYGDYGEPDFYCLIDNETEMMEYKTGDTLEISGVFNTMENIEVIISPCSVNSNN
tara:strand:- start:73 stop:1155 length:1083 start_codon:yes stop_codon:yes gene_type:complete